MKFYSSIFRVVQLSFDQVSAIQRRIYEFKNQLLILFWKFLDGNFATPNIFIFFVRQFSQFRSLQYDQQQIWVNSDQNVFNHLSIILFQQDPFVQRICRSKDIYQFKTTFYTRRLILNTPTNVLTQPFKAFPYTQTS